MQKVLIDSSSWVSYFLGLEKKTLMREKVGKIIIDADIVCVPEVIYSEVINVVNRLRYDDLLIAKVKDIFDGKKFRKYTHGHQFWFENIEIYSKKITLSTQDLLILGATFEQWPCALFTGDKKLETAYYLLKTEYENF